jgi:hypothetical protein
MEIKRYGFLFFLVHLRRHLIQKGAYLGSVNFYSVCFPLPKLVLWFI